MDSNEKKLLCFCAIVLVFFSYLLGFCSGICLDFRDAAVIREVGTSNRMEGKYVYSTNQFDFVSDSIYHVGDTVSITKKNNIMNYPINEKCIIRTNRAGVFFATLAEYDDQTRTATLKNCRRLWFWSGAASLSQLAVEGVKNPDACKFTITVPEMQVMEVIEIIPATEAAIKNIENVISWKR